MFGRLLVMLTLLAVLSLLITACGGSGDSEEIREVTFLAETTIEGPDLFIELKETS